MRPGVTCSLLLLSLGGCQAMFGESAGEYNKVWLSPNTKGLVTTADIRTVMHRTANGHDTVCTEPPPDVAKALSTALALSASAPLKVGTVQGSVDAKTAEEVAQLTGRVPGLLALRDGLFRACEAYSNGVIGSAAYALILSRYGELLTTVILADAVNDPSQSTKITIGGALPADGSKGSSTTPSSTTPTDKKAADNTPNKPAAPAAPGAKVEPDVGAHTDATTGARVLPTMWHTSDADLRLAANDLVVSPSAGPAKTPQEAEIADLQKQLAAVKEQLAKDAADKKAAADKVTADKAAADKSAADKAATSKKSAAAAASTPATNKDVKTPTANSNISDAAAAVLERMQANYLNLDVTHPLLLACIGQYDPTLKQALGDGQGGVTLSPNPAVADGENPALSVAFCKNFLNQLLYYQMAGFAYGIWQRTVADVKGPHGLADKILNLPEMPARIDDRLPAR